jgi:DnaK suppressor protein
MLWRMETMMTNTVARTAALKQLLVDRRRQMQIDVDARVRDGRTDRTNEVRDMVDLCDVGIEEELSFALLQMRTQTLAQVDAALVRLESGKYGTCFGCGVEIPEGRLRALPFAVRCRTCEERLEQDDQRRRQHAQRDDATELLPEFPRS